MNPRPADWGSPGDLDGLIAVWAYKDFHLITDQPADQGDRLFLSLRTSRYTLDHISEWKDTSRWAVPECLASVLKVVPFLSKHQPCRDENPDGHDAKRSARAPTSIPYQGSLTDF